MKKVSDFFKSTLIGGLLVILPSAVFIFIITWIFDLIHRFINPLTRYVMTKSSIQGIVADCLVILFLIGLCFVLGAVVRTKSGKWLFSLVESQFIKRIPGYSIIKDTVTPFLGSGKSPFSSVALANIFCNDTLVTVFITDQHEDGSYTVFYPSGPIPTSGFIYHLKSEYVFPVNVSVEDAMRTIISCGAGSSEIISKIPDRKI